MLSQTQQQKRGKKDTHAKNKKKKKSYRVRNWKEYNEALVNRGRISFWIDEKVLEQWKEDFEGKKRKPGRPKFFSDVALETALTLQQVFHQALRQTEGMLNDILKKLGSVHTSPDYSTLSIRSQTLSINIRVRPIKKERLHVVVDSSGVKVYGEGEWKVRQHGWSKRRTWKKIHIGVDEESGDILLGEVTGNDTADCEMLPPMLNQLPEEQVIDQTSGDGAYDQKSCYDALKKRNVSHVTIPPRKNARIWKHGNSKGERQVRDENLRQVRKVGRKKWKIESGYHRRSLVETTMFRLKTIFSDSVSARSDANQRTQLLLRMKALNRMTTLGMPVSYAVAG